MPEEEKWLRAAGAGTEKRDNLSLGEHDCYFGATSSFIYKTRSGYSS